MTDTVNVPQEARYGDETASQIVRRWAAWIIDASAEIEQPEWGGKTDNDVKNERDFLIRSLLAAAPKAEPVSENEMSEWLRDGFADLHFEESPEYQGCLRAQPEAPKVEQEPVAWRYRTAPHRQWHFTSSRMDAGYEAEDGSEVQPLYTHPAPASDELLEALEPFARYYDLNDCHERRPDDALEVPISDLARAAHLIAKHKGPQS